MGGKTGSGAGVGAVLGGIAGGLAAGLVSGGLGAPAGAAIGAGLGGATGATIGQGQDAAHAARVAAAGLNKPVTTPPAMPSTNSADVQKAKLNSLFALQNRSGRASTLLTTANTTRFGA